MNLRDASETKIVIHHVGARSGGPGWFRLPNCRSEYLTVLYEADAEALDDLATLTSSSDIILPYCLGAIDGPGVLHITYCQFMSSLYPITEHPEELTQWVDGYDYRNLRTGRTMEHRKVRQHRLDGLAEIQDGRIPPPTILSLDTQGSEADIVMGGANTIRENTLAIVSEVEFIEYYKSQPLFGDLSRILDELGFLFVGLLTQQNLLVCRQPLGFRGPGFTTHGDALFIRRVSAIEDNPAQLLKLGLIALTMGHVDYAFEAWLRMPRAILNKAPYAGCAYAQLVRDLLNAYDTSQHVFPKEFEDFYSWELSRARFDPNAKEFVKQSLANVRREIGHSIFTNDEQAVIELCSPLDLPLESALRRHGLTKRADQVKARRLSDIAAFLSATGLEETMTFPRA